MIDFKRSLKKRTIISMLVLVSIFFTSACKMNTKKLTTKENDFKKTKEVENNKKVETEKKTSLKMDKKQDAKKQEPTKNVKKKVSDTDKKIQSKTNVINNVAKQIKTKDISGKKANKISTKKVVSRYNGKEYPIRYRKWSWTNYYVDDKLPEGRGGRIYVGGHTCKANFSNSQGTVDTVDSCAVYSSNNSKKTYIADHNFFGMVRFLNTNKLYWVRNGKIRTYTKVATYRGINTGYYYRIGKKYAQDMLPNAPLVTITCVRGTSDDVYVSFWR